MATFHGNAAAFLLVSAIMVASVLLTAAEPTTEQFGEGEPMVDVNDGPERRVLLTSPQFGGAGGTAFNDNAHAAVQSLVIRCGNAVDQIRTKYTDSPATFTHGRSGGSDVPMPFNWNQPVTIIIFTGPKPDEGIANMVRGIKINQGPNFRTCGFTGYITGSQQYVVSGVLKGFFGRAGKYIDALGIYY